MIGLSAKDGALYTEVPPTETIKALRRMVLDLANKTEKSRSLNKTDQMVQYVSEFSKSDLPDLRTKSAPRSVESISKTEFAKSTPSRARQQKRKSSKAPERKNVVPKNCPLTVTDNRILEIYIELQTLRLTEARNAIAVLLRVFLELSADHFLEANNIPLTNPRPGGGDYYKPLDQKVRETVDILVQLGAPRSNFAAVDRSLGDKTSPLHPETLGAYVHDRFSTPSPHLLTAAWDHAQPLFERIWA